MSAVYNGCQQNKERCLLPSSAAKERVLVVEDDFVMLELLSEMLGTKGINVLTASTYEEARKKALEKPSLIIIDLFFSTRNSDMFFYLEGIRQEMLGETPPICVSEKAKDGFGLSSSLKADPQTVSIPILAIGPMDTPYLRRLALAVGCDEYLGKPFGMNDLLSKLRTLKSKGR